MSLATGGHRTRTSAARAGDVRAALVAVLATIDGITAYPVAPDQATAGAAWPKWIQTLYTGGKLAVLAVDTYEVLLTLPASYLAVTVDQGDAFRDVVSDALRPVVRVESVEPAQITFNDRQTMPGLRLRVVHEGNPT